MIQMINKNGIPVKELRAFLNDAPDDAIVLLNHQCAISNPEDNGSYSVAWTFDPIIECRCEQIPNDGRYSEWKSDDKIIWLTHNVE